MQSSMLKQLKSDFKLRQKYFDSAKNTVIVKAINCIGFINSEAHSRPVVDRLAALLRTPQIAYLLPSKHAALRSNAAFRITELSIDANSVLRPNSLEKAFIKAITAVGRRPGSDHLPIDLIVLANAFDKFAREAILKPTSKMIFLELTSTSTRYRAVSFINGSIQERTDELAAWLDSLVCLSGTAAFGVPHYCESKTCHTLPRALPDGNGTVFQLPGLDIVPGTTLRCFHCGQLTSERIATLKTDIQIMTQAPREMRFEAWQKMLNQCDSDVCPHGMNCKSIIHRLRLLEHCFLGPRLLNYTLMALGKNLEFSAAFDEAKQFGRSDKLRFCFEQVEDLNLKLVDPIFD